jgi:NAD(P)-dependent dehydrogenase (short-subunit alcohol dehydrogenase family)
MLRLKPLAEQVVVLVGASSGIGREAALAFAARGARVVVAARGRDDLASLVQEIEAAGGRATAVAADVSRYEDVERIASTAVEAYGGIDTWVHLASVTLYAKFADTTPDEFRRVLEVDLLGQVHGAMAALPWLRRQGRGALLHVSSVEALRALPYQSAYAAAKHGVKAMLEALRLELRRDGVPIAVTNVMPSSIATPAFRKARTKLGVEPRGIPPVYDPQLVVQALLRAAEHPQRDVVVGGAGRLLVLVQALSPRLADAVLQRIGFWGQRTGTAKGVAAPDDLYQPLQGVQGWRGSGIDVAAGLLRAGLLGVALGALLVALQRRTRS